MVHQRAISQQPQLGEQPKTFNRHYSDNRNHGSNNNNCFTSCNDTNDDDETSNYNRSRPRHNITIKLQLMIIRLKSTFNDCWVVRSRSKSSGSFLEKQQPLLLDGKCLTLGQKDSNGGRINPKLQRINILLQTSIQMIQKLRRKRGYVFIVILLLFKIILTGTMLLLFLNKQKLQEEVQLPITIPRFNHLYKNATIFYPMERELKNIIPYYNQQSYNSTYVPDYGSLNLTFHYRDDAKLAFERQINPFHYAMIQSSIPIKAHHQPREHIDPDDVWRKETPKQCEENSWTRLYLPNCNYFHEYDLTRYHDRIHAANTLGVDKDLVKDRITNYQSRWISYGYYRDVFLLREQDPIMDDDEERMVFKILRYKRQEFDERNMRSIQKDALVMERLTSSPRIVNIYGHCAFSVSVEAIEEEVEEYVVPGDGLISHEDLKKQEMTLNQGNDVIPQNDYTATEKLEMALTMAESIADLHGFKDGVIVHDDIQLCQWLRKKDGSLVLGDFNRATFMLYNEDKGSYCEFYNGPCWGNYRSPEEFAEEYLDEKMDVFSFGNNIYGLLTGLWVFYENEDDEVVHEKLINGTTAYIDERYRQRSYAESKLVEIMEQCWIYNPEDRVDIFQVVKFLRNAVLENQKRLKVGLDS